MKSAEAQRLLASSVDDLVAGKIAPAVQIDLVDAAQSSASAPLQAKLDAYAKARGTDSLGAAFRDAPDARRQMSSAASRCLPTTRRPDARAVTPSTARAPMSDPT